MKELELIRRCRKLEPRAQRKMVDMYSDFLFHICRRYLRDESLAKDCLQESWIQILWNLDKYNDNGRLKPWIATVTINKCKDILKKHKRWHTEEILENRGGQEDNYVYEVMDRESVDAFLSLLPDRPRMVLNMYLIEGYSHKEIADILEISVGSSRSILSRTLQKLRQAFPEPIETLDNVKLINRINLGKAII